MTKLQIDGRDLKELLDVCLRNGRNDLLRTVESIYTGIHVSDVPAAYYQCYNNMPGNDIQPFGVAIPYSSKEPSSNYNRGIHYISSHKNLAL